MFATDTTAKAAKTEAATVQPIRAPRPVRVAGVLCGAVAVTGLRLPLSSAAYVYAT